MSAMSTPWHTLAEMLGHPFVARAFAAGTVVAVLAGLAGCFLVLRAQVFSSDVLAHVAFTGAIGALALGFGARGGLYVATVGVALALGLLGERGRADDTVIGSTFAWVLGVGALFLSVYASSRSGRGFGTAGVSVLFGSVFGLSASQALEVVIVGGLASAVLLFAARPLLFSTLDPEVAVGVGVPARALGVGFLVVVGITAAEATPTVGALLLVGLVAGPAAAALRITGRPYRALLCAPLLAVAAVWIGLTASYAVASLPPSSAIIGIVVVEYAVASRFGASRAGRARR